MTETTMRDADLRRMLREGRRECCRSVTFDQGRAVLLIER